MKSSKEAVASFALEHGLHSTKGPDPKVHPRQNRLLLGLKSSKEAVSSFALEHGLHSTKGPDPKVRLRQDRLL